MRGNELLDKMALIDPAYVEAADQTPKKKNYSWLKFGALAACLCLIIIGVVLQREPTDGMQDSVSNHLLAFPISLDSAPAALYHPISFEDRQQYGLVPADAIGLDESNTYKITESDLGEWMGTVISCGDESLIGCNVYHFAKYPNKDSICIVDTPNGYAFYVCHWLYTEPAIGDTADVYLSVYGLPESLETMELCTPSLQPVREITDTAEIDVVFALLSGKTNIGLAESNQRFAQAWYDAYGNDDVFFSEESGYCKYRNTDSIEKAKALWTEGEQVILITTDRGYQMAIDFFPAVGIVRNGNGYYDLTADEVETLTSLLQSIQ